MIETERLILRGWVEEDAEALFRYARDPEVGPVAGWAPHESVDYSREIIRTVFASPEVYAVVSKQTGEPVGCCGLVPFGGNPTDVSTAAEAEIGYWIGKPFWGHGLIPEAVNALLTRAFTQLNLTTVWGSRLRRQSPFAARAGKMRIQISPYGRTCGFAAWRRPHGAFLHDNRSGQTDG